MAENNEVSTSSKISYYDKGSVEPVQETAVTARKLEKRRLLTIDSHRLVLVLVGLPGRGKSFIARKLYTYFNWQGANCKIFNVGRYRREAVKIYSEQNGAASCDANFFDANNEAASKIRHESAALAMNDMIHWLHVDVDDRKTSQNGNPSSSYSVSNFVGHFVPETERVAIFDATNSTKARRKWIVEQLTSHAQRVGKPVGIVFVESICDDEELLEENFKYKVMNSPDFVGMSVQEAITDLRNRVRNYEDQYETVSDDSCSYIKLFNLSSKLLANQIYGRMSKNVVPALMAWNIGTRPIWICRSGETGGEGKRTGKVRQGESLGPKGCKFRDDLHAYVAEIGRDFMMERSRAYHVNFNTGTSISGGISSISSFVDKGGNDFPPCEIMTSTMPRAWQTVLWENSPVIDVNVISNLNPLDKGDFTGLELEEIRERDPDWYEQLVADPYNTRYVTLGSKFYAYVLHYVFYTQN